MSVTSALNPNVVKSGLDALFFKEYNIDEFPYVATANDPLVFYQYASSRASETIEEFKGAGEWSPRAETAKPAEKQPLATNSQTYANEAIAAGIEISKHLVDDDQNQMYMKTIRDFAMTGRISRDKDAMSLYRDSFTSTGGDGQFYFDTDHPITGGTMSNKLTVALSEANLNTAVVNLGEQEGRDGLIRGYTPHCLLVPYALFKTACEITDSELRSGTANNDMNVFSTKYGIYIKTSPYLGTAAGGNDAYWWLLSRNHGMIRFDREEINTNLIDWRIRENRTYYYNGEFRQTVGQSDPFGAIGSTGGA
jgi:hypothetical protein